MGKNTVSTALTDVVLSSEHEKKFTKHVIT